MDTKMYIAVLDEFPDYMTPTLVAHAVLGYHQCYGYGKIEDETQEEHLYSQWLYTSFKKVVLRVNEKEFDKIADLYGVELFHENKTLEGKKSCAVVVVEEGNIPSVLKYAKLWKPKG